MKIRLAPAGDLSSTTEPAVAKSFFIKEKEKEADV
jgi:hypothetical protein